MSELTNQILVSIVLIGAVIRLGGRTGYSEKVTIPHALLAAMLSLILGGLAAHGAGYLYDAILVSTPLINPDNLEGQRMVVQALALYLGHVLALNTAISSGSTALGLAVPTAALAVVVDWLMPGGGTMSGIF